MINYKKHCSSSPNLWSLNKLNVYSLVGQSVCPSIYFLSNKTAAYARSERFANIHQRKDCWVIWNSRTIKLSDAAINLCLERGNMIHLKRLFPPRHNQWHRTRWLPRPKPRGVGGESNEARPKIVRSASRIDFHSISSWFNIKFPCEVFCSFSSPLRQWTSKLFCVILKFPSHRSMPNRSLHSFTLL